MVEVAGDGGKANANVFSRLCHLGSLEGVFVCQRVNGQVGILIRKLVCNAVDKANERTGSTAFNRLDFFTVVTRTMLFVVVLRNGKNFGIGVCFQYLANVGKNGVINILVCQAGVGSGSGISNCGVCQKEADGVHKEVGRVGKATAKLFAPRVCPAADNVDTVFCRPCEFSVICYPVIPVCLAQLKCGGVVQNDAIGNVYVTGLANLKLGGKEAYVCAFFKELINSSYIFKFFRSIFPIVFINVN